MSTNTSQLVATVAPVVDRSSPQVVDITTESFDLSSIPMSAADLPPFPFLVFPQNVIDGYPASEVGFDRRYVLAGTSLQPVEGRTMMRYFPRSVVGMSALEASRHYTRLIEALGAVKVNTVHPLNDALVAQTKNGREAIIKQIGFPGLDPVSEDGYSTFAQYLIRKPGGNVWMSFALFDDGLNIGLLVIQEKQL